MNTPPIIQSSKAKRGWAAGWGIISAVAGLGCIVLPHYLLPPCNYASPPYRHTLIPWFATAVGDIHFPTSLLSYFVLGGVLGIVQPQRWRLMGLLSFSLPTVLNTITVVTDMMHNSDAHNFFPIEFAMMWFVGSPVLLGAFLGSRIRRSAQPPQLLP
jgi:hypothetical protein